MAVIYIREQGSYIRKVDERIAVTRNNLTVLEIPVANMDNIALMGNVQITTQALQFLMDNGIDVSFFTFSGKYIGQAAADRSKNVFLRFAQYELYNDVPRRISLAKTIVNCKIDNQIRIITKHDWRKSDYDWKKDVESLQKVRQSLQKAETSNEVMGVEGMCSNIYFSAFGKMFHCDFIFTGRNRRPPKDPINILISLGYTFLTRDVSAVLDAQSFEMYLGILHGIRYGRKSLPLDLMEEFRQPVVDQMVIRVCNKRIINQFDFDEEGDRIVLTEEGFKKFCHEYEKWINGKNGINYRGLIRRQAIRLRKTVLEKETYQPFKMEEISEKDDGSDADDSGEL